MTLKFRNLKRAAEEIASVDYFTRCRFINHKPVTAIRYFQYRVKIFLRAVILISGPPSNGKYYAIHLMSFGGWLMHQVLMKIPDSFVQNFNSVISATMPSQGDIQGDTMNLQKHFKYIQILKHVGRLR